MQKSSAFNSNLFFLHVYYSPDAKGLTNERADLPTRLVLKCNVASDYGKEAGRLEVKFYQLVATLPDHPPMLPWVAAEYDQISGNSYLLMIDMSGSHVAPDSSKRTKENIVDLIPAPVHIEGVIDTLAQLHAYWWQHPLLYSGEFTVGYWSRNAERFALYLERRQRSWNSLIAQEGDWLPADIRALYERVLVRLPEHWERYLAPRFRQQSHLTLIHGDAYFANFLSPKPAQCGATYLIDWQSPSVGLVGYDLANLITAFWTPAARHQEGREQKMLQRYYSTLCHHGVTGYSWDELLTDYRCGLVYWLLLPVQDRFGGAGKAYWWPKMQCLLAAFEDWDCMQLLDDK
ncbi:MAG: phosphotransferase [Caldilineaceae bacterium]